MYAPLRGREAVTIAVKRINDAISAYKRSQKAPAASVVVQNAASAADELRKFKELMDMGVITQEEFNQKKKQLLGFWSKKHNLKKSQKPAEQSAGFSHNRS